MDNQVINTSSNIEEIVKLINRTNESFCYGVWIPSLAREVMFREINTSQQKRLIKAIIDSPVYNTEFIFALYQVIKENCADKTVDVDSFTIIDKLFIAIKMRIVGMGDILNYQFTHKEKEFKKEINLTSILKDATENISYIKPITITDGSYYSLECCIPTINTEYRLENELRRGLQDQNILNDSEKLRKVIGDTFVSEICKFITSITIKDMGPDGQISLKKIDLSNLSFRNRITIIENLPAKLLKDVITYIEAVKKEMDKVIIMKFRIELDDGEVKEVEERLAIDSNFFTAS